MEGLLLSPVRSLDTEGYSWLLSCLLSSSRETNLEASTNNTETDRNHCRENPPTHSSANMAGSCLTSYLYVV